MGIRRADCSSGFRARLEGLELAVLGAGRLLLSSQKPEETEKVNFSFLEPGRRRTLREPPGPSFPMVSILRLRRQKTEKCATKKHVRLKANSKYSKTFKKDTSFLRS